MKKLAIVLLACLPIGLFGQNIKGIVVAEKDKSPVAFASVGLLSLPDSTINTGGITLTDGGYSFENVKPGNYFVKINYVGYAPNGRNVTVSNSLPEIIVDTIFLSETSQALSEVTVIGERLQGKEMVDRTVYTIPSAVAKTLSNGYDLLRKIPQVQVDFQNNVTLNGSQNFIIQVDGKQRDKEFLAKLDPNDIETIEIISNPSGKYEGNIDGVLNIVLKREARFGLSGSGSAILKPFNKQTAIVSGNLDYGMGDISFYISAFTFAQALNINNSTEDRFKLIDSTNLMKGIGDLSVQSTSINTGFDYYLNDKNNISFNINYKPIGQDISNDNNSSLGKLGVMDVQTDNSMKSDEGSASLFYKKTFKKAIQELSIENTYYMFESRDEKDFRNNVVLVDTAYSVITDEMNVNERNYFSSKVNYVHPFGMSVKLEGGYQFYYQKMNFDFDSNDDKMDNIYDYTEVRHSVYAGLTLNLKKFGFQSNVRLENTDNDINNDTSSTYYCFLPSANLQYKFSASQNIKLTYNRRINRPGVYDLNPSTKVNPNNSMSEGNSKLEPEYRDRLQLTYSINFGKNYCSPYVYFEHIDDKIGTRNSLGNNKTTILTRPENLFTGDEYGAGLNAMLWILNINARYYKGTIDKFTDMSNSTLSIPSREYSSYSLNGYFFAQLPKKAKLTEFIFFNYNGVNINAQSKSYSLPFYGFGAQKEMGNHNIGFVYLLPFYKNVEFSKTITETESFYSKSIMGFDVSWYIQFMYTYKFNKGKSVKKLNRKADIESDSKSEGIGR